MESISEEDRSWAIYANAAGLLVFTSIPFANVLATLLIWLRVKRMDAMPFSRSHAARAFNFQVTYSLVLGIGAMVLMSVMLELAAHPQWGSNQSWLVYGLIAYGALTLANVVICIVGAVAASDLRPFRYPLAIPFVR